MQIVDENQRLVDEARDRLLKQHGGYKGLWDFLLRQERSRQRKVKTKNRKASAKPRRRKAPAHRA